jgi:hypothetical protein
MRPWLAATLVLIACPAPDPVDLGADTAVADAEPSIHLVHPPEGATYQLVLTEDCQVDELIAVDIDNFELLTPESAPPTDGQGHWHFDWGGVGYAAADQAFYEWSGDAASLGVTPGALRNLTVTLQANDHADLDQFEEWSAFVEYEVIDDHGCFP